MLEIADRSSGNGDRLFFLNTRLALFKVTIFFDAIRSRLSRTRLAADGASRRSIGSEHGLHQHDADDHRKHDDGLTRFGLLL